MKKSHLAFKASGQTNSQRIAGVRKVTRQSSFDVGTLEVRGSAHYALARVPSRQLCRRASHLQIDNALQVWLVKHKPSAEYLCLKEIARAHVRTREEALVP